MNTRIELFFCVNNFSWAFLRLHSRINGKQVLMDKIRSEAKFHYDAIRVITIVLLLHHTTRMCSWHTLAIIHYFDRNVKKVWLFPLSRNYFHSLSRSFSVVMETGQLN